MEDRASLPPRRSTSTSVFGAGRRESHDSSAFYARFRSPAVDDDEEIGPRAENGGSDLGGRPENGRTPRPLRLSGGTSPRYFVGKEYEDAVVQAISYLSGMRPEECLALKRGCCQLSDSTDDLSGYRIADNTCTHAGETGTAARPVAHGESRTRTETLRHGAGGAMNLNIEEPERRLIRDAMARLLDGDPIRSGGKLTVKSLAAEAGLKRWYLTHKHTDLRDEFYDRVRVQGTTPAAMTRLYEEIAALKEARKRDRAALRDAVAQKEIYARETQVLALENAQLKKQASARSPVRRNRPPPVRSSRLAPVRPISGEPKPPDDSTA